MNDINIPALQCTKRRSSQRGESRAGGRKGVSIDIYIVGERGYPL